MGVDSGAAQGGTLEGVLHCGSKAGDTLKTCTDIDLIVYVACLPCEREERRRIGRNWEAELQLLLDASPLSREGLFPSLHLRVPSEADRPSRLYWDVLYRSEVVFDGNGFIARQMEQTRQWLALAGARREERGFAWTWIFDDPSRMEPRTWEEALRSRN